MIFQNSLIKSLIYKIKKYKFLEFFDKYRQTKLKIKCQNNKKIKKTNSTPQNFEKKIFHMLIFFVKELLEFSINRQ